MQSIYHLHFLLSWSKRWPVCFGWQITPTMLSETRHILPWPVSSRHVLQTQKVCILEGMHLHEQLNARYGSSHWNLILNAGGAPPQMQHLADKSLPILLEAIAGDESKEAVASAVAAVAEFVASGACQARLQDVSAAAINILKGEAICQEVASDCEEWEDSESAEVSCHCLLLSLGVQATVLLALRTVR